MIDAVAQILERCGTPQTNVFPTILYNEGWMTRLLVEVSKNSGLRLSNIDFAKIRRCPEVLSNFVDEEFHGVIHSTQI